MSFLRSITVFAAALSCFGLPSTAGAADPTTRPTMEPDVATGADVARLDESTIEVVLHVDPNAGDDGDGTADRPFATIQAAFDAAEATLGDGRPTKISLAAGVYRDGPAAIDFDFGEASGTLLVVEGQGPQQTVLSGSDVWPADGWTDHGEGLYSHDWPHDWGHFAYNWGPPQTLGHRREMVFVDGALLRQVEIERYDYVGRKDPWDMLQGDTPNPPRQWVYEGFDDPTADAAVLPPGTFGVAERDENGNRLYVRLDPRQALSGALIEVGLRRQLLVFGEKDGLVLRGIGFQHAVNDAQPFGREPAVTFAHDAIANLLVDDCHWRWNNFAGHALHGRNLTFRDCDFSYNGYGGIGGGAENVLLEGCSTNFNNWRGFWGDQVGWNMAGVKLHGGGPITLRDHAAVGNLTHGIWFDIHPRHVRVEHGVAAMNFRSGIFFELSDGPHLAVGCLLVHNREQQFQTAVFGRTALRSSVLYGDTTRPSWSHDRLPFPVATADQSIRPGEHADRAQIVPDRVELSHNVLAGGPRQEALLLFVDRIPPGHPLAGATQLVGGNNLFAEGRSPRRFVLSDDHQDWRLVQLDSLVRLTGLDSSNRHGVPHFRDPNRLDFRVDADSPLDGRDDLPLRQLPREWVQATRDFYDWVGADAKVLP